MSMPSKRYHKVPDRRVANNKRLPDRAKMSDNPLLPAPWVDSKVEQRDVEALAGARPHQPGGDLRPTDAHVRSLRGSGGQPAPRREDAIRNVGGFDVLYRARSAFNGPEHCDKHPNKTFIASNFVAAQNSFIMM